MLKFDLLINRHIFLYLGTKEKIEIMSLVCKEWRKLVYSGYAWENINISYKNIRFDSAKEI